MDKYTVLREDIEAMTEAGLTDAEIGETLLAMVRYGMDGTEPDFNAPGPRIAFAMLKKRMDKYIRKCETNAANGQSGGRPKKTEENPTETQPKPNETQHNPSETYDYDYEQDNEQGEDNPVSPCEDTHTENPQAITAPARVRPGWFDPAHPDAEEDGAWRYSVPARKATAQRIIAHVFNTGQMREQFSVTAEGVTLGENLFAMLCLAMQYGLTPRECLQMADDAQKSWQWERDLREYVVSQGGTRDLPERCGEETFAAYG